MPKTIMISGPHGIGKTTTAVKLVERFPEVLFVQSFAGKIAKQMDYDLNKNPSPDKVLEYQQKVLIAFQMHYDLTLEINTIYDRSPLDFAAYTMMQLRDYPEMNEKVDAYVQECIKTTMGYCDLLILPRADLTTPYETKVNRPVFSPEQILYREDYAALIEAYAELTWLVDKLPIPTEYQYDDRVDYIVKYLDKHEVYNASI